MSSAANGAKLSEMRARPRPRAHCDGLADEPLVEPVRRRREPGHRRERERRTGPRDREVQKALRLAAGTAADHEQRVLVLEAEERVERHHEPAGRGRTTPPACDRLELPAQVRGDLARMQHTRRVPRVPEPVNGLADLADRSPVQRERRRLQHRLVPVVEGVKTVSAVDVEAALADAENGDPPVALPGERDEPGDKPVELGGRADRVARHDRNSADDPIGEERALVLAEEVRLVGAQHERRERVCAPPRDQTARRLPLPRLLLLPVPPGRQPRGEEPADACQAQDQDRDREPLAEAVTDVRRAAQRKPGERAARLVQREAERERLIGRDPVDPERSRAVGIQRREENGRSCRRAAAADRRVAGCGEVLPPGDRARRRRAPRKPRRRRSRAGRGARRGRAAAERRVCPRAGLRRARPRATSTNARPSGATSSARDRVNALGSERLEEVVRSLRQHRVQHADEARSSDCDETAAAGARGLGGAAAGRPSPPRRPASAAGMYTACSAAAAGMRRAQRSAGP